MLRFIFHFSILIIVFVNSTPLLSNEKPYSETDCEYRQRNRFGAFAGAGMNLHDANFSKLPGVPNCCPQFTGGSGFGYSAGLLYENPFLDRFYWGARLRYSSKNGEALDNEPLPNGVQVGGELTDGEFRHELESTVSTIDAGPVIGYRIFEDLHIWIGAGASFLVQKEFSQRERLTKPENSGVFADTETRVRNDTSGNLPNPVNINYFAGAGVGYDFPLNSAGTLLGGVELAYSQGLADIIENRDWKIASARLGLAIKYCPKPAPPRKIDEDELEDEDSPDIEARITVFSNYPSGERRRKTEIRIVQQYVTRAYQFLPYIFFDKNSSLIAEKYNLDGTPEDFSLDKLPIDPIAYQSNILNIVGSRMRKYSDAAITVRGFADPNTESSDCILANSRAEEVKQFLVNTWNIDADRIKIPPANPPCVPENQTLTPTEEGFSENRRVEIASRYPAILAPIGEKRYLEVVESLKPTLEYNPAGSTTSGIESWQLVAYQSDEDDAIFSKTVSGSPKTLFQDVDANIANRLVSGENIKAQIHLKSKSGEIAVDLDEIPVVKDTSDVELERLSLAVFQVSGDKLRGVDMAAIDNFVSDLGEGDTISVIGYTDKLGDPDENKRLSDRRAKKVCEHIRRIFQRQAVPPVLKRCEGVAFYEKPPQIFSYDSPEERYFSRTVFIEIKKKRK